MSHQLWATYSVRDHLDPGRLAADILLYDRLVFPVPQIGKFPDGSGSPVERGPVTWERNPDEWTRWERARWDPEKQERLLELLKPVVRKVPWSDSGAQYEDFRQTSAELAARNLPGYAFAATRTVLTRDLPAYVSGVAALGPAYRSIEEIERDLRITSSDGRRELPGSALANVLAWEFFAPDPAEQRLRPEPLLKETVEFVTGDADFQKHRTAFVEWQKGFLRGDKTDRESVEQAVEQMRGLLSDLKSATSRLKVRKSARYAFQLAPAGIGVALAAAGIPEGLGVAAAGAFFSLGGIFVDEKLFKSSEHGGPQPAAFVNDARRHFGWK